MMNKTQLFIKEIPHLIEVRALWNKLSDSIYNIAYGELESTEYIRIYNHYENALKDIVLSIVPKECAEIVENYFEAMVLEFAENRFLTFQDKEGNSHVIINPADMLDAIISWEYTPSIAI